jgi:hypothetical protein
LIGLPQGVELLANGQEPAVVTPNLTLGDFGMRPASSHRS